MTETSSASPQALERVPVFPLPDFVVFPGTPVPLHFFEPRYRALIEDVVASDNLIVTARLAPGWQGDYDGTPALEAVGTLARVVAHRVRPNGTHDAVLLGLGRVAIGACTPCERGYRNARVSMLEERTDVPRDLHTALIACATRVIALLRATHPDLSLVIDPDAPACRMIDMLSDRFVSAPDTRAQLLALTDASARAEVVLTSLAALARELEPDGPVS